MTPECRPAWPASPATWPAPPLPPMPCWTLPPPLPLQPSTWMGMAGAPWWMWSGWSALPQYQAQVGKPAVFV